MHAEFPVEAPLLNEDQGTLAWASLLQAWDSPGQPQVKQNEIILTSPLCVVAYIKYVW